MFFQIFKYKLKSIFLQKDEFFWILMFPLILGTCFYAAFSDITSSTEDFETIPVAVVNDTEDSMFHMMTDSLEETEFLKVISRDGEESQKLLNDGDVVGIVTIDNGIPTLTVLKNGIYQTMMSCVLDQYMQSVSVLQTLQPDPVHAQYMIEQLNNTSEYLVNDKLTSGNTDNMLNYYYALVGMACMFGAMSGNILVKDLKANLSAIGMRKSLSAASKTTMILGDFAAVYTLHAIANVMLICYLNFILGIELGNVLLVLVVSLVGSLIGISLGICLGTPSHLSDGVRMGLTIGIPLFLSFLSGLMTDGIKQDLEKAAPIINRLNPAALISDCLYSLNIYDTYDTYINRLSIMVVMSIIMCSISILILRRETYDSI